MISTPTTAAPAIRIGRTVRLQGNARPDSCGFVLGYCNVLATQRALATSYIDEMSRSAPSKPKPGWRAGTPARVAPANAVRRRCCVRPPRFLAPPAGPARRRAGQIRARHKGQSVPRSDRLPIDGQCDRLGQVRQLGVGPKRSGEIDLTQAIGNQHPHPWPVPTIGAAQQPHSVRSRRLRQRNRCWYTRRIIRPRHVNRPLRRGRAQHSFDDP